MLSPYCHHLAEHWNLDWGASHASSMDPPGAAVWVAGLRLKGEGSFYSKASCNRFNPKRPMLLRSVRAAAPRLPGSGSVKSSLLRRLQNRSRPAACETLVRPLPVLRFVRWFASCSLPSVLDGGIGVCFAASRTPMSPTWTWARIRGYVPTRRQGSVLVDQVLSIGDMVRDGDISDQARALLSFREARHSMIGS